MLITGLGAVSSLGHGLDEMWSALAAGRDGMAPIERFSTEAFTTHLGGMVATNTRLTVDDVDGTRALVIQYALEAGREALRRWLMVKGNTPSHLLRMARSFHRCEKALTHALEILL